MSKKYDPKLPLIWFHECRWDLSDKGDGYGWHVFLNEKRIAGPFAKEDEADVWLDTSKYSDMERRRIPRM